MSLVNALKSLFGGSAASSAGAGRETDRLYLVDAEKLAEGREGQGRIGPVERFQAIQQLSRFAEREKVTIVAVVGGRPLREVAHGESYNGVQVFYVEANATLADTMTGLAESKFRGRKVVVVTNDRQLESKLVGQGVTTLRITTLRRALEGEGGGGGGDNRNGGRRRRGRGDRGERGDRAERPDRQTRDEEPADAPESAEDPMSDEGDDEPPQERERQLEPKRHPGARDTIDNLIDRVD